MCRNILIACLLSLVLPVAQAAAQAPCPDCGPFNAQLYLPVTFNNALYKIGTWHEIGDIFTGDVVADGIPYYVQYIDVRTPAGETARVMRGQTWTAEYEACWTIYWGCVWHYHFPYGYAAKFVIGPIAPDRCPSFNYYEGTTIVLSTDIPTIHPPPDTCIPAK